MILQQKYKLKITTFINTKKRVITPVFYLHKLIRFVITLPKTIIHPYTMNDILSSRPETLLPTKFGTFRVRVYELDTHTFATAIISGPTKNQVNLAVRVHSACLTGESFESLKCDCKGQLDLAMTYIAKHGGVILYLQQEGRGIGLGNKIRAYALQEQGHDTVDANLKLGFAADLRTYDEAAMIIADLGITSIHLLTNNPEKVNALKSLGIPVTGRIPVLADVNQYSAGYLESKRARMGHMLESDRYENGIKRPFVHVNFAINSCSEFSADNGSQLNLSCSEDWQRVHALRETYTAVAVGVNTWYTDQPKLTAREEKLKRPPAKQPDRVIFAGQRPCEFTNDNRRTFIIGNNHPTVNDGRIAIHASGYDLDTALYDLREQEVMSLLVEGGPTLIRSFLQQGHIDLLTIYVATKDKEIALKSAQKALPFDPDDIWIESFGEGSLLTITSPVLLEASVIEQKNVTV